jgi:hypothetical protein
MRPAELILIDSEAKDTRIRNETVRKFCKANYSIKLDHFSATRNNPSFQIAAKDAFGICRGKIRHTSLLLAAFRLLALLIIDAFRLERHAFAVLIDDLCFHFFKPLVQIR